MVDRALYLPRTWADDETRCRQAPVPDGTAFATEPRLAEAMLKRAWGRNLRAAWVTADAAYGHDGKFRRFLEKNRQPSVLAVPSNQSLFDGESPTTAGAVADGLAPEVWRRVSAGAGSKGPREYAGAVRSFGPVDERGWPFWLVVRRHRERSEERASYFARGPVGTEAGELIRVAGSRWAVEECFELAKGECGLDEYEVRSGVGWHRHVTLRLFALAVVAVIRSRAGSGRGRKEGARG